MKPTLQADRRFARMSARAHQEASIGDLERQATARVVAAIEAPVVHQVPAGCAATVRGTGYGRCFVRLTAPTGAVEVGGQVEWTALRGAVRQAERLGLIAAGTA